MIEYTWSFILQSIVVAPRLAKALAEKGYTPVPMDAVDYIKNIVDEVLARRRSHSERRNDFIQIMVDHEEEVKNEEQVEQLTQESREQKGNVLKKSMSTSCQDREWSIIDLVLALNDKEIFAQAFVFLLAGYETTSVLMSFFFYVMATEPSIQEKVYEEIRERIGDVCSTIASIH